MTPKSAMEIAAENAENAEDAEEETFGFPMSERAPFTRGVSGSKSPTSVSSASSALSAVPRAGFRITFLLQLPHAVLTTPAETRGIIPP